MYCIFCGQEAGKPGIYHETGNKGFNCPNCGPYIITEIALMDLPLEFNQQKSILPPRHIVSGWIRDCNERNIPIPVITSDNLGKMIEPGRVPRNVHEKAERLLTFVSKATQFYSETIEIKHSQLAIAFAINQKELIALAGLLQDEQLAHITNNPSGGLLGIRLTAEGLERAAIREATGRQSKRAFVAMWFTEEMDAVFETAIKPGAKAAGYDAFRIVDEKHNNDINAEIIAAIRRSRFLVADLTGQRGGVYFEAGFAMGLGIPVIWSCRKDWFNTEVSTKVMAIVKGIVTEAEVKENRRTHFDVEHFPFLIWESAAELHKKLKDQIEATIEL